MELHRLKDWTRLDSPLAAVAQAKFPDHAEHVIESVGIITDPIDGVRWTLHCHCGRHLTITEKELYENVQVCKR